MGRDSERRAALAFWPNRPPSNHKRPCHRVRVIVRTSHMSLAESGGVSSSQAAAKADFARGRISDIWPARARPLAQAPVIKRQIIPASAPTNSAAAAIN